MFKDLMNMVAGEMLFANNFNTMLLEQQIQLAIVMIGSNPFWG